MPFQMLSFGRIQTTVSVGDEAKWPPPNRALDRMTDSLNYLSVQSLSRVQKQRWNHNQNMKRNMWNWF